MTDEREVNEPNSAGFAGDPATPEPQRTTAPAEHTAAEDVAIPGGDLTGPATDTLEPTD